MNILYLKEQGVSKGPRIDNWVGVLRSHGHQVDDPDRMELTLPIARKYDIAILLRPMQEAFLKVIPLLHQGGCRVMADVDDDFWQLPTYHPAYMSLRARVPILDRCLMGVDGIMSPSPLLAKKMGDTYQKPTWVIPNGWVDGPSWQWVAPNPQGWKRLGWAGTRTHRRDVGVCMSSLTQVLKEAPNTQIVIGLDEDVYKMFSWLPEERRLFIPGMSYEYYPLMLGYFDILLAPLEDIPFNHGKSAIKLTDATAKGIPWVASDLSPYHDWKDSPGYLCDLRTSWLSGIRMAMDTPRIAPKDRNLAHEVTNLYPLYEQALHGVMS